MFIFQFQTPTLYKIHLEPHINSKLHKISRKPSTTANYSLPSTPVKVKPVTPHPAPQDSPAQPTFDSPDTSPDSSQDKSEEVELDNKETKPVCLLICVVLGVLDHRDEFR